MSECCLPPVCLARLKGGRIWQLSQIEFELQVELLQSLVPVTMTLFGSKVFADDRSLHGPEKPQNIATEILKFFPGVLPAWIDWSILQLFELKEDESVTDSKAHFKALFLCIPGPIQ